MHSSTTKKRCITSYFSKVDTNVTVSEVVSKSLAESAPIGIDQNQLRIFLYALANKLVPIQNISGKKAFYFIYNCFWHTAYILHKYY